MKGMARQKSKLYTNDDEYLLHDAFDKKHKIGKLPPQIVEATATVEK